MLHEDNNAGRRSATRQSPTQKTQLQAGALSTKTAPTSAQTGGSHFRRPESATMLPISKRTRFLREDGITVQLHPAFCILREVRASLQACCDAQDAGLQKAACNQTHLVQAAEFNIVTTDRRAGYKSERNLAMQEARLVCLRFSTSGQ